MNSIMRRRHTGFTALEMIIATGMLMTLVLVMIFVLRSGTDSFKAISLQSRIQHDNRVALDVLRNSITPAIAFSPIFATDQFVDSFTVTAGEFDLSNDANGNGLRDPGEPFDDANANGIYDGPSDALLLTLANGIIEEPFTDLDGDGKWDAGEPYTDLDGDGKWTDPNANGMFDPTFRTFSFPMTLAGKPDSHSLIIFAPFTTPDGHRQLRQYTIYRRELDIDGDGQFVNTDTNGDGNPDVFEDQISSSNLSWDPPYVIDAVNNDAIVLKDKSLHQISVDRNTGEVDDAVPYTSPRVICNDLHYMDVSIDVDPQQRVLVYLQLALIRNVESFNVNATGKGRVHSTLTTAVWLSN